MPDATLPEKAPLVAAGDVGPLPTECALVRAQVGGRAYVIQRVQTRQGVQFFFFPPEQARVIAEAFRLAAEEGPARAVDLHVPVPQPPAPSLVTQRGRAG